MLNALGSSWSLEALEAGVEKLKEGLDLLTLKAAGGLLAFGEVQKAIRRPICPIS